MPQEVLPPLEQLLGDSLSVEGLTEPLRDLSNALATSARCEARDPPASPPLPCVLKRLAAQNALLCGGAFAAAEGGRPGGMCAAAQGAVLRV